MLLLLLQLLLLLSQLLCDCHCQLNPTASFIAAKRPCFCYCYSLPLILVLMQDAIITTTVTTHYCWLISFFKTIMQTFPAAVAATHSELMQHFLLSLRYNEFLFNQLLPLLGRYFIILLFLVLFCRKIHYLMREFALNCTRKPISRSDVCDIGFQVQFNAEFTSQVMNFYGIA